MTEAAAGRPQESQKPGTASGGVAGAGGKPDGSTYNPFTGAPTSVPKDPQGWDVFIKTLRVDLGEEMKSTFGEILEDNGFYAEAARLRGSKSEASVLKRTLNKRITVSHVVIGIGATGAIWLVYEGLAYALKDCYMLPSMLRDRVADSPARKR